MYGIVFIHYLMVQASLAYGYRRSRSLQPTNIQGSRSEGVGEEEKEKRKGPENHNWKLIESLAVKRKSNSDDRDSYLKQINSLQALSDDTFPPCLCDISSNPENSETLLSYYSGPVFICAIFMVRHTNFSV